MKKVEPVRSKAENEKTDFFDPNYSGDGVLRCCCGYELIKESEDTYRCTGGNHRYHISEGDVIIDKYGNIMLRMKGEENNKKKNDK